MCTSGMAMKAMNKRRQVRQIQRLFYLDSQKGVLVLGRENDYHSVSAEDSLCFISQVDDSNSDQCLAGSIHADGISCLIQGELQPRLLYETKLLLSYYSSTLQRVVGCLSLLGRASSLAESGLCPQEI